MIEQIFTVSFLTAFLAASVRMAVPLAYAGLGETISEKCGILNIGMEGVMLSGAFFSFAGAYFSGSIFIGLLCGMAGGVAVSMIHAILCVKLSKDQSVSGIAINIFVLGVTSFLYKLMSGGQSYQQIQPIARIRIPVLAEIPFIGEALFHQDILTYLLYFLILAITFFYKKTSAGLSFAAIGENPASADSAGIPVFQYQYLSMALNGVLGGMGGACLVLVSVGNFSENMTSGRGYIALATVILGRFIPVGMLGAAFLFGCANALQIRLQAVGVPLPSQALSMLPHVITLVALLSSAGKNHAPDGLGKPYVRGAR